MLHKNFFSQTLEENLEHLGGLFNAHAHIDRFATASPEYLGDKNKFSKFEMIRLWDKQSSVSLLHKGLAYETESLERRMSSFLEMSVQTGVKRLDSFVDVTDSIPLESGMGALNIALNLKEKFSDLIDFRVGAYAPFGFRRDKQGVWQQFVEAAEIADFIATSPERDDPGFYGANPQHIGLKNHFARTLELALNKNKPVHYHLDQQVDPRENCTEMLLDAIERSSYKKEIIEKGSLEPFIWGVHVISPSTYSRERQESLIGRLAKLNIGVICCPSAAISMSKLSFIEAPLNKGIAEVLLMLIRGIQVRIGTDNVDDIFLPVTSLDPRDEIAFLSNALRFYEPTILAKLLCGHSLNEADYQLINDFLKLEEKTLDAFKRQKKR